MALQQSPGESTVGLVYHLPERPGYPEAIKDPAEIGALVTYFRPHIDAQKLRDGEDMLERSLYNPLNIEHLSRLLNVQCPLGYSSTEMQARLDTLVPCATCGDMIRLYSRSYNELGGRCNWDCVT